MAVRGSLAEDYVRQLTVLSELAVEICLLPCRGEQTDPAAREEAEELLGLALEIKDRLDVFLTDEVRADIVQLIEHFDQNRERYRLAILRWVDLLEDVAHYVEQKYGDGAGVLKQREVRAAMYYLVNNFFGPEAMPNVPPFLRPVVLEVITRVTVEFLVTLDNPETDPSRALWRGVRSGPPVRLRDARVRFAVYRDTLGERFVGWLVRIFMPRPYITPALKARIDPILEAWAERNRLTGTIPVQRAVQPFVDTARWIGRNGDQVRAAVDAIAMATHLTARFTRLDREERMRVVKEAVVIMFEELGYRGPMFATLVRFMVDMMAEATENLFRKRGII